MYLCYNKVKFMKNKHKSDFCMYLARLLNFKEMREHKFKTAVYIVLRVTIVIILITSIVKGKWENTMTCVMSLALLMIPLFIEKKLKIGLPTVLETITILFVFAANVMGELGAFYEKIPLWDTALHAVNGFICAGVGFGLTDILNRNEKVKISLSPIFVCLFSFCFSMTAGTVWEFFEFAVDSLLGKDMQKDTVINVINSGLISGKSGTIEKISGISSTIVNGRELGIDGYLDIGLIDTMKDLIVNFVGAAIFNAAGFFYLKGRLKGKENAAGFIDNFIPKPLEHSDKKV